MNSAYRNKAVISSRELEDKAQLVAARVRILELECAIGFYAAKTNWGDLPKFGTAANHDVLQIDEGHGWDVAKTALHGKPEAA